MKLIHLAATCACAGAIAATGRDREARGAERRAARKLEPEGAAADRAQRGFGVYVNGKIYVLGGASIARGPACRGIRSGDRQMEVAAADAARARPHGHRRRQRQDHHRRRLHRLGACLSTVARVRIRSRRRFWRAFASMKAPRASVGVAARRRQGPRHRRAEPRGQDGRHPRGLRSRHQHLDARRRRCRRRATTWPWSRWTARSM